MKLRLGQLLVESGILADWQVERVLQEQAVCGQPFGLICERLFHVDPEQVEHAWSRQYAGLTRQVDPRIEAVEPRAAASVTRRQAWQFRVMPLRFDGDELVMATTQQHLPRALRFANNVIGVPVYFVLASPAALGEALCQQYPMAGMTPSSINDDAMDLILGERGMRLSA